MMIPSTMILTICISMVLKRNRGLSLDIGSRHERAEQKTHNSNHKSQTLDTISATNSETDAEAAQVISKL